MICLFKKLLFPHFILLLVLLMPVGSYVHAENQNIEQSGDLVTIDQLAWQKRLILVKSGDFKTIQPALAFHREAMEERRVAWFVLTPQGKLLSNLAFKRSASLIAEIEGILQPFKQGSALLIGYDGEIKSAESNLQLESFFELIDSMPIRQYEMQQAE